MDRRALALLAAIAACGHAAVLAREASPGFLSYPIVHEARSPAPVISRRASSDTNVPLYNISTISYLVALRIGTPGQDIKVAIDTGSDELWVNPQCQDPNLTGDQSSECVQDGQYKADSSSTSKQLQDSNVIPYGKGKVAIDYFTDSISLPDSSISMTDVQFGVASDSADLNEGILGLGFGQETENLEYQNFVEQLASQKVTNSKAFSVALGAANSDNGGVIIFGGVDTKKFSGNLAALPIMGPQGREPIARYWVQLDSVGLTKGGSSKTYTSKKTPVVLDSGSSLSYLPQSVVQSMADDLGGRYSSSNEVYMVPCSQAAASSDTVDFVFNGNRMGVPLSEFIWNIDGRNCALGAIPVDDSGSGVTALLGDTFMRSAYVIFDQSSEAIYMAPYANCGQNEQAIPADKGAAGKFAGECKPGQGQKNAGARTAASTTSLWSAAAALACVQAVMSFL